MSRSYRHSEFDAKRAQFADRKAARRARAAEFEALGYDESEALAALPLHGEKGRSKARRALNNW